MNRAVFALLALAAGTSFAEPATILPSTVGLHLFSVHAHRDTAPYTWPGGTPRWNNSTPGLYARWPNGITAGVLPLNSLRQPSAYIGYTWETKDARFALTAGAISGYPMEAPSTSLTPGAVLRCGGRSSACRYVQLRYGVRPLLSPSVVMPLAPLPGALRLNYLPRVAGHGEHTLVLSWEIRL